MLGVLVGVLALFWRPLRAFVDRYRLPEVRVVTVLRPSRVAAGALTGVAANGYVVARVRAALSADTPGRIVEMNVAEGSVVKRGDVVARLYADEYRAAYERSEADLSFVRSSVESQLASEEVAAAGAARAVAAQQAAAADLEDARAALRLAEVELERAATLAREGIGSRSALDAAQAGRDRAVAREASLEGALQVAAEGARVARLEHEAAAARRREAEALVPVKEAERDQALATLDKTVVRAPFDGVVVLKDAEVGEVVSPNAVGAQSRGSVATMVDFSSLEVQVEMPETGLGAVRLDAPARVFLDAWPEHGYAARVLRIWPTANRQKATVEVRVGFDDPDERLRPEMGARVVFVSEDDVPVASDAAADAPPPLLVSRSALVPIDGAPHAFVLERDLVRLRAVRTGAENGARVAVLEGLREGERVVDQPPAALRDGDRVRVVE